MATPDIITHDGHMYDLKTVNVEAKVIHTDFTWEIGEMIVTYNPEMDEKLFTRIEKLANFMHRLKRRKGRPTLEAQLHIFKTLTH